VASKTFKATLKDDHEALVVWEVSTLGVEEEGSTVESWRLRWSEGRVTSHGAVLFAHSPELI
jgi:hypothetical protein